MFVCKKCAECCRNFGITLGPEDLNREPRLWSVALPIYRVANPKLVAFMREKKHPWAINAGRGKPCPFLTRENLCGIYETRPQDCRDYPQKGAPCLRLEKLISRKG